jgi:hypothetical protein
VPPHPSEGPTGVQDRLSQDLNAVEIDCDDVVKYSGIDAEKMPLRRKLWRSDEDAKRWEGTPSVRPPFWTSVVRSNMLVTPCGGEIPVFEVSIVKAV